MLVPSIPTVRITSATSISTSVNPNAGERQEPLDDALERGCDGMMMADLLMDTSDRRRARITGYSLLHDPRAAERHERDVPPRSDGRGQQCMLAQYDFCSVDDSV